MYSNLLKLLIGALFLSGIGLFTVNFFLALLAIATGIAMIGFGLKEIQANPPHKGLITLWGARQTEVLNEGYVLVAPYFPFFLDFIPVKMATINIDFIIDVSCKVSEEGHNDPAEQTAFIIGAQVKLRVGITYKPSAVPSEMIQFLNNNGEAGVKTILDNVVPQTIRQEGSKYSLEQLTESREPLIIELFRRLIAEDLSSMTAEERNEFSRNGRRDIHGLGIVITKINVGTPEAGDEIKKAAESRQKEEFERRGEVYEVETEMMQAEKLKAAYGRAGETKTLHECILEIRRRKTIREGKGQVLDIPGLEAIGSALAAMFGSRTKSSDDSGSPDEGGHMTQRRRRK